MPLEKRRYGKGGGREGMRPTFIVPWKARNILIEGITLRESPMWNVAPGFTAENIIVRGITVHSLESPNGDGIVPDSCKNVLIEYNHLETGDDAVVIKSGLNEDGLRIGIPSENIVVRNFSARDVRTGSGGIVFGSETSGAFATSTCTTPISMAVTAGFVSRPRAAGATSSRTSTSRTSK